MPDEIPTVIPRYIDKSVYYVVLDSNKKYTEGSYSVKSTYKGILRMSPNNTNSLFEDTNVQLIDRSAAAVTDYKDSLNEFLEEASGADQMIRVSTSDGFFIDMRLNMKDVEFDNLYVESVLSGKTISNTGEEIEPFTHKNTNTVLLYPKTGDDEAFSLGSTIALPVNAHRLNFTDEGKQIIADGGDPIDILRDVNFKYGVGEDTDNSSILFGKNMGDKRVFEYKRSSELIEELVQEALMSFHTVPTGSIHFVPVNFDSYKALVGPNKSQPNMVLNGKANDPIVRDYLPCDGRKYWIKDFPELAKILEGEKITYEREVDTENGIVWRRFTHINKYDENTQWFRVPDLRHKFIKSPYLSPDEIDDDKNNTGVWNVDSLPSIPQGKDNDRHYHFIALPEYNADQTRVDFTDANTSGSTSVAMVLNGMTAYPGGTGPDLFTTCGSYGRCAVGRENHTPAIHFFTHPIYVSDENYKDSYFIPDTGITSTSIIDKSIPTDPSQHLGFGAYQGRTDEFNTSDMIGGDDARYGMENNPEFYACVPVIKI